jgi:predicted small lipoprotein YifL
VESCRRLSVALMLMLAMGALAACEQEGPAERAGEAIDNATENTGEAIERAGEKIQDGAQ